MTEQEALMKLGAKDWRSLSKGQIMSFFFEMSPNLSDEVRLRILESAPEILNTVSVVLTEYQETAQKALEHNQETVDKVLNQNHDMVYAILMGFHQALETLRGLLSDPNATFEEKKYWNEELSKHLCKMCEYDRDNKTFLQNIDKENKTFFQSIQKHGGAFALLAIGITVAALTGGKFSLPGKDI